MSDYQPYIAIIPARGGSKRLPGKNLLALAGKPLIAWTIEAAIGSGIFDRVVVSTDDQQIAKVATQYGAEVPFLRPAGLATDTTPTIDVLIHAIQELSVNDRIRWSHLACLQPTSPLRTADNIRQAAELLEAKSADAVISVCQTEHSPLWANTLPENLSLTGFIPEQVQKTPSQQLPVYYRLNGAIYFCQIERMLNEQTLFLPTSAFAYVMSREDSIDVDDPIDFELAGIYSGKKQH